MSGVAEIDRQLQWLLLLPRKLPIAAVAAGRTIEPVARTGEEALQGLPVARTGEEAVLKMVCGEAVAMISEDNSLLTYPCHRLTWCSLLTYLWLSWLSVVACLPACL